MPPPPPFTSTLIYPLSDLDPPVSNFTDQLPRSFPLSNLTVAVSAVDTLSNVTARVSLDDGEWIVVQRGALAVRSAPFQWTNVSEGLHVMRVSAVDAAGNVQPPPYDTLRTIVDSTPPVVNLVSLSAPVGGLTSRDDVVACVAVSDLSNCTTTLRLYRVLTGEVSQAGTYGTPAGEAVFLNASSCLAMNLTMDGNHTLVVSASDDAGNVGVEVVVWFVADRLPPSSAVTQRPREITNTNTVPFTLVGEDSDPLSQLSLLLFVRVDGGRWQSLNDLGSQVLQLPDGQHVVEARAVDGAGNTQVRLFVLSDFLQPACHRHRHCYIINMCA